MTIDKLESMKVRSMSNYLDKSARAAISIGLTVAVAGFSSIVQSAGMTLEEVVVTAQKREESVQEVPIAINVLNGDQMRALGVQDTDDIMNLFPNLSIQGTSAINSGVTIRGVGTSNWHITGQQSVGQYMDEVSLISPYTSQLGLFDMERVEVMRGPQNTLFGRNTTGGAINYISNKPNLDGETTAFVSARLGNENRADFEGAIGFSLGENLAARIAFQSVNRDGIFDNLFTGKTMGDIERNSGRLQLLWAPSDSIEMLFNAHVGYSRSGRTPAHFLGVWDSSGVQPVAAFDGDGNIVEEPFADAKAAGHTIIQPIVDCPSVLAGGSDQFDSSNSCVSIIPRTGGLTTSPSTGDWHKVYDSAADKADVDFEGVFFRITKYFETMSLVSLSSYDEISVEFNENNGGNPDGLSFMPGQSGTTEVFSQEIRLASSDEGALRWIAGGFYSREEGELATIIVRFDDGAPPFGVVPSITIDQEIDIWSAYGQVDYDFTDDLTFTLGLRFTSDSKEGTSIARLAAFTDTGTPVGNVLPLGTYIGLDRFDQLTSSATAPCPLGLPCRSETPVEQDLEEWGGKIGAEYRISDDLMTYASYSRGFKSGAFDTRALAAFAGTADQATEPEFMDAYELGFKSTLANGNVELNGAVFYYVWEDRQQFDVDNQGRVAFLNIPEAELTGAELDVKWATDSGWYLQGGVGYLDTEITDKGDLVTPVEGAPLSNAPEFSINGLISKTIQIGAGELSLQTNFRWVDEYNSSLADNALESVDEVFFINLYGAYYFGNEDQYEIALWADNITEEKTCTSLGNMSTLGYQAICRGNDGMAFYGISGRVHF